MALQHDRRRQGTSASALGLKKQRGPEPCGARASAKRAWKEMRLCAPSTRWPAILIVVMCTQISRSQTRQQAQNGTRRDHGSAHERTARCGSAAGEGGCGGHGRILVQGGQVVGGSKQTAVKTAMDVTVNSLYFSVNHFAKNFLRCCPGNPRHAPMAPAEHAAHAGGAGDGPQVHVATLAQLHLSRPHGHACIQSASRGRRSRQAGRCRAPKAKTPQNRKILGRMRFGGLGRNRKNPRKRLFS